MVTFSDLKSVYDLHTAYVLFPLFTFREKKMSRTSALKVLDHGMIGAEGADNCHKFVDILGLRTIFPLFMKTPKKMKKTGASEKEHEGRSLTAVRRGGRNVVYSSPEGPQSAADVSPSFDLF